MTKSYNLLDEPWLPVRYLDGRTQQVGLKKLFGDAHEIATLADTSPPNVVAQYRLLLAIVHRALTGAVGTWTNKDRANWYSDGLPSGAVEDYLERWSERFWLFHPEFPFMQVAALNEMDETRDREKPWTQISLASVTGNAPAVFDHACDLDPSAIKASDAIRILVGFLQFTTAGLVKVLRSSDKAGPLVNTAAALPLGESLEKTFCLALHLPGEKEPVDIPAWEKPAPTKADLLNDPVPATGPNDRYTRLSRSVLLKPEPDGNIRKLRFAVGAPLLELDGAPDPMASYRAGNQAMVRLTFREGRALWRDLPALLPEDTRQVSQPAAVLGYAANLLDQLDVPPSYQPLLVAGLASDKAKLLRWRAEQISLPIELLENPPLAGFLRQLIGSAEDMFRLLRNSASRMIADTLPESDSKETYARARSLFDGGPAGSLFFAEAERNLPSLLGRLGKHELEEAEEDWGRVLHLAAEQAWSAVYKSLGQSGRALRAEAIAYPRFRFRLKQWAGQAVDNRRTIQ